jgi:hypothetical protein
MGIDNVQINLADQDALTNLLSIDSAKFDQQLASLDGISLTTIDMAAGASVSLSDADASALLADGLSFAADDSISLQAEAGSTHLSTSLKDLQKLGVDAVAVAGAAVADVLHVNLGGGEVLTTANVPSFDTDLNVTLGVSNAAELAQIASLGGAALAGMGIDNVELSLAGQVELNDLLISAGNTDSGLSFDLAALNNDALTVSTIDMGGSAINSAAHITDADVATLVDAGLHFAANDYISVDASAAQGTHLSASLQELHKLGVDTLNLSQHAGDSALMGDLGDLTRSLKAAGLDLGLFASDLAADSALLSKVETFDWVNNGVDFSLHIDTPAAAPAPQSVDNLLGFVDNGIDLLNIGLSDDATWGDLIGTLRDAGLGNVEVASQASVSISDDLSAALYESGMLHALPDAAIAIDAGVNKVLNTSLKAMADLGVDSVNADHKVYVELGIKPEDMATVADLGDLFSAFGLHSDAPDTHLFGENGAGLVIDQTTFNNLGEANIETLVGQLSKLGFTELDVVGATKADEMHVYEINVTAQTPVLSEVQVVGSVHDDLAHVFDPDILKNNK